MNSKFIQHFFVFITFLFVLGACAKTGQNNTQLLDDAGKLMETDHKQAIVLLKQVSTSMLSEDEHVWFMLLQVRGWSLDRWNIGPSEANVLNAKNYYIDKNDAAKTAYACFIYAYININNGDLDGALYNYLQADEWAGKVDYKRLNFIYSAIPYNIALIYRKNKKFEISLAYLDKAIKYIAIEKGKYQDELYALELKGINFRNLNKIDSAIFYYDKALKIVEEYNDSENRSRILYNQSMLYYHVDNYDFAKEKCRQAIETTDKNDSIALGHQYLRIAQIYNKTNQLDSAIISIYKSKDLLITKHINTQRHLYETLFQLDEKRGNFKKAQEHKQLYNYYKEQLEKPVSIEIAQLQDELKQTQANHIGEIIRAQFEDREKVQAAGKFWRMISYILLAVFVATILINLLFLYKTKKMIEKYAKIIIEKEQEYKRRIIKEERDFKRTILEMRKKQERDVVERQAYLDKEAEMAAVRKAFKRPMREQDKAINDWRKKCEDSEEESQKYYSQLVVWYKDRGVFLKTQLREVIRNLQRIRDLEEMQEHLSLGDVAEAKQKVNEIKSTMSWENIEDLLSPNYGSIFEQFKEEFPILEENEYGFCCLHITNEFSASDIMLLLNVNEEQFNNIKISTLQKLNNVGKDFDSLINYGN